MQISLIRFLDFSILLLIVFPWIQVILRGDVITRDSFGKIFTSSFVFVFVFFLFSYPTFWEQQKVTINLFYILLTLISSVVSLAFDFATFKIKYGVIKIRKIRDENKILFIFLMVLLPAMEEILFRGFLKEILYGFWDNNYLFIVVSSFAFALNHMIYAKLNILTKFFWGICFSLLYLTTGNIIYPIFSHIINNMIIYFVGKYKKGEVY